MTYAQTSFAIQMHHAKLASTSKGITLNEWANVASASKKIVDYHTEGSASRLHLHLFLLSSLCMAPYLRLITCDLSGLTSQNKLCTCVAPVLFSQQENERNRPLLEIVSGLLGCYTDTADDQ